MMYTKKRMRKLFAALLALAMLLSVGILGTASAASTPDMLGEWSIQANNSRGRFNVTAQSGNEFSGTVNIDSGKTEQLTNGTVSGNTVSFTRSWAGSTLRQDYTGTLSISSSGSATISGSFTQNGSGNYSWSASKTTPMTTPSVPAVPPSGNTGSLIPITGAVLNEQLNFKLNGSIVVPVGDDGTPVLPISYNGTTYLPVRAVGYLLGLGIDWDGATNTVLITSTTTKAAPKASSNTKGNRLIPITGAVLNGQLKFKLDGKAAVPVGDDGTPVLPISYNGTTYLPVRAMGYLLGLGIDWDGNSNTVLISSSPSKTTAAGWYFTYWEYYKDPYDTAETGGKVGRFANGDTYTDYTEGKGEKNNFTNVTARRLSDGKIAASGHAVTLWSDPPAYFSGNDRPSITINRTVESTWGIGAFSAHFDNDSINPGGGTSSYLAFVTPDGQGYLQSYQGTIQMEKALKGSAGSKKAIILYLNGHGFKYYYEWRE